MTPRDEAITGLPTERPEPPFQAVAPNLDRVSRDAFRTGTLSRRRIVQSSIGLLAVAAVIAVIVVLTTIL